MRGGFLPRLLRGVPYIIAAAVTTIVLEHFGLFAVVDTRMLDAFLLTSSARHAEPFAGQVFPHVTIVGIDNDDYNGPDFNGESPLKPSMVARLVAAVQAQNPRLVGVDIDTSTKRYAGAKPPLVPAANWAPLVWAAAGDFEDGCLTGRGDVLGGVGRLLRTNDLIGIDDLPVDDDGQVRHYTRAFPSKGGTCGEEDVQPPQARSFVDQVAFGYCRVRQDECGGVGRLEHATAERFLIDFRGECVARDSSTCVAGAVPKNDNEIEAPHSYIPARTVLAAHGLNLGFEDRIVLIGGFFDAGRDAKTTSFGERQGVELLARAVETELAGGGVRDTPLWASVLFDIVVGVLLVYVGYRFTLWPALGITLALFPLTILLSSVLAFMKLGHWVSIAPIFFGMALHTAFEDAIERAEHRREHAEHADPVRSSVSAAAPVEARTPAPVVSETKPAP